MALRDSAGVAMFEAWPASQRAASWTVRSPPDLLIGDAAAGEPLYRVQAGRLFADGSFVIANGGNSALRFYTRDGVLERSAGREGSGPNEFRWFAFVELIADSVWVYDPSNQRVSVLDRAGEFIRLIPLTTLSPEVVSFAEGVFDDGSILLRSMESGDKPCGLRRHYARRMVLHPDGAIGDLGRFFLGESYCSRSGSEWVDLALPWAQVGLTSVRGGEWFFSAGERYRVEQYATGGRLRGVFSYLADPEPLTQHDLDEHLSDNRAAAGRITLRARLMREAPRPERWPAYAQLVIDREGNVWAAPHAGFSPQNCWHVYSRRPSRFATACLPDRLTVLDIAQGALLGVLRDENDVERIARYRLVK